MQPSVNSDWLHRAAWPCAVLRSARVSDDAVQATVTEACSKTTNRFLSSDIQCGISVSVWSNCLSWAWLCHVPIDTQWLFLLSLLLPADPASIASLPGSCVWAVEDPHPDPSRSPAFLFLMFVFAARNRNGLLWFTKVEALTQTVQFRSIAQQNWFDKAKKF